MNKESENKYFIYARKSTESEDRQARSIEDQLTLIWTRVRDSGLTIVDEFNESLTASKPGRPVFREMLERIEAGEANGIISYHPDRLARNSVDGGRIMYLLDTGQLQHLIFDNFYFENTSQGMYMLYLAFAQSKYYTDNLSDVVKRGINSRIKRGIYPGAAKRGYLNHPKTKEIIPNPVEFDLVREMFELYASGQFGLGFMGEVMFEKGLKNKIGNPLSPSQVQLALKDPFYYGHFKHNEELYEGIHKACITKELFDQVQSVMKNKGKAKTRKAHNHKFLGFMICNECGYAITAEQKKGHIYYRCSKKSNKMNRPCSQPYLREEELVRQLNEIMEQISLPKDWLTKCLDQLDKLQFSLDSRENGYIKALDSEADGIQAKLARLADLYIERDISRAEYLARKESLLGKRIALLERRKKVMKTTDRIRLELMRKPLMVLQDWISGDNGGDHEKLREFVSEVGSNFRLNSRKVLWNWIAPYSILASRGRFSGWQG